MNLRPLTRRKKAGDLYTRDEAVEHQIEGLASLSSTDVITRAQQTDSQAPEYVREETLVYWIREYQHLGQLMEASELAQVLMGRCVRLLQSKLFKLGPDYMKQASQDALSDLLKDIVDLDSDRADFLQIRFWHVLELRVTNVFNQYLKIAARNIPLSTLSDEQSSRNDELLEADSVDGLTRLTMEEQVLVRDALATIPEPYRTAFVLCHYHDWPIESKDLGTPSISRYFGKTPRTIHNWLKQAEDALRDWREEEH